MIEFVDSKGNFTAYVKMLIKQEMEKEKAKNLLQGIAPEVLQELLKGAMPSINTAPVQAQKKEEVQKPKKQVNKNAIYNILKK